MPDKALKATSPEELSLDKLSLGNSQEDPPLSNPSSSNPSSSNPPFKSRSFGSRLSENSSSRKPAPKKRAPKKNSGGDPPSPEDGFSKSSAPGTSIAETGNFKNNIPENKALEKNASEKSSAKKNGAKKRKNKKRATDQSSAEERPSWSMHPNLHDQVQERLDEVDLIYTFEDQDAEDTALKTYDTKIMGSFICENKKCRKQGWDSKMIAITIREYWLYRYNARVYHQRCMECGELGKLVLDEECYAERVSYRIKYWCDVSVKPPPYEGSTKQPHEEDWCEGCKHGRCKRRSGAPDRV